MEISHPNQQELMLEQQQELEKLRTLIEQASADGIINKDERDSDLGCHASRW